MNIAAKTFGKGYRRGPTALSSQYSLNGRGALRPASGFRARFTSRGRARATSVGLRPPSVTHANIMARRSKESNPQAQGQGITVDQTGHLRHDLNASVASLRGVAVFIGISGRFRRNTQLEHSYRLNWLSASKIRLGGGMGGKVRTGHVVTKNHTRRASRG